MFGLIRALLRQLGRLAPRRTAQRPPARPNQGKQRADEQGSPNRDRSDCTGTCKPSGNQRAPADLKSKAKLERQMEQRGWTYDKIDEAVAGGQRFPAKNNQTGGPATRYVHPKSGQSVVLDDTTGGIIHVGGPGFVY